MELERGKFHGGCVGCTNDLHECPGCKYFEANWGLPDKNPKHAERDRKINYLRDITRGTNKKISPDRKIKIGFIAKIKLKRMMKSEINRIFFTALNG